MTYLMSRLRSATAIGWLCVVALAGATVPARAAGPETQAALVALPNASFHGGNRVGSGGLDAADIPKIAAAGVREVIDLRTDSETPGFDEAAAVRAAGMQYHNLPIRGPQDLTPQNVRALDALLSSAGDAPVLVHCASSNRVGALMALRAATLQGKSTEAAIEVGKAWGLTSLEPVVREHLAKPAEPAKPAKPAKAG